MKLNTCYYCDREFEDWNDIEDLSLVFCSEQCKMDKYGVTEDDFYPTSFDDKGPPE